MTLLLASPPPRQHGCSHRSAEDNHEPHCNRECGKKRIWFHGGRQVVLLFLPQLFSNSVDESNNVGPNLVHVA